jgi:hypothetical protein
MGTQLKGRIDILSTLTQKLWPSGPGPWKVKSGCDRRASWSHWEYTECQGSFYMLTVWNQVVHFLRSGVTKNRLFLTNALYQSFSGAFCRTWWTEGRLLTPLVMLFHEEGELLSCLGPVFKPLVSSWAGLLCMRLFHSSRLSPWKNVEIKYTSVKIALLVALKSPQNEWVSCIHCQFSIHAYSLSRVFPRFPCCTTSAFMPTVSSNYNCIALELVASHLRPFPFMEEERFHRLCPVCTLHIYLDRTWDLCKSDQLCVLGTSLRGEAPRLSMVFTLDCGRYYIGL